MDFKFAVRVVLGLVFGFIGYQAAHSFITLQSQSTKELLSLFAAVCLGVVGVFVIPIITKWTTDFIRFLSRRIAAEVISQLHLPKIPSVGSGPKKEKVEKEKWVNPMLIDTSALIDGRIGDVIESGFIAGTVLVPDFILFELQHIADSADSLKRSRGRRGLEVLDAVKKSNYIKTVVYETGQNSLKNVDDRLLKLGKTLKAKIITNDYNLNKIATVSGVKILNVNELANVMKTPLIPGEEIEVKVIQEGKEKTQGVGYLPDGTMIVVENGADHLGKKIKSRVSRVIQTVAGRMIFVQATDRS